MKFARGDRGRRCNRYEADLFATIDERRRAMLCPVLWCSGAVFVPVRAVGFTVSQPVHTFTAGFFAGHTAHLRAAQSGAYLHLIMHYWQHGGVPDDNAQLAAIARMTDPEWKKARPIIEPFFQMPGWKHKRVEYEIARADEIGAANSQKAREAAERRWAKERADKLAASLKDAPSDAPSIPVASPEDAKGTAGAMPGDALSQPRSQEELRDGTREARSEAG
jgi:uncharacterized protein YdaU (DUF1376 family)